MIERRRKTRRQTLYYLRAFDRDTEELLGYVDDMTDEGLMLKTKNLIEVKKVFQLRLLLPEKMQDLGKTIECKARSLWSNQDIYQESYFTGFSIDHIGPEDAARINAIIEKYGFKYF